MAPVSAADRSDRAGVARCRKPLMNGGADLTALDRRIARTMVAGDQEHDALTAGDCLLEAAVDAMPCVVERQAVEIEHAIGLDGARTQPPVPARIEGGS
jgi:hypothetical protein